MAFAGPLGTSTARWGMELEPLDGHADRRDDVGRGRPQERDARDPGGAFNDRIRRVMDVEMAAIKAAVEADVEARRA